MADQKIVTETALSAFASDVKGELINKIGYDELPTISDNEPYNFRPSGNGKGIGDRETDMLVGGSVVFNQLEVDNSSHITTTQSYNWNNIGGFFSIINGHKYFASLAGTLVSGTVIRLRDSTESLVLSGGNSNQIIISAPKTTSGTTFVQGKWDAGAVDAYLNIIDLTQMFGSTIADYIYNLEQANTGAGVAYFRKLFPKPYYAYNAGELMSVKTSAHKTVGFNQFDYTRFAREYPLSCSMNGEVLQVSSDSSLYNTGCAVNIPCDISNGGYISFDIRCGTATYVRIRLGFADGTNSDFGGTNSTSYVHSYFLLPAKRVTSIKFNWSGSGTFFIKNVCVSLKSNRGDVYEPYEEHTYALDSDLELRGIPKLDANNNLYYDGDEYESDGTVTRKCEYRAYASGDESLPDTITDGTHTVTKLATPTTETADTFTNPQIVNDFGTEEYVDERAVAIPVGHETEYVKNMDNLLLPATPSADGTYTLKCTVSGGTPTLSWVADT